MATTSTASANTFVPRRPVPIRATQHTHVYSDTTANPGSFPILTLIGAGASGTSSSFARGDHDHEAPAGSFPQAVTAGSSGAYGTASSFSRGDHRHPAGGGSFPADIAAAGAYGTSSSFARSDHDHAHGSGYLADAHHAKSHILDPGDHTISGKTAGQFLRATSGSAFAFDAPPISRGGTVYMSGGIPNAALNIIVWRAPFACTVTNVRGYRVGGTGATINARRNGTLNHLASALSVSSADTWMDGGAVSNTAYAAGDKLEIMIVTTAGTVTQLAIQVDYTRP